jgi:hypothetical protein
MPESHPDSIDITDLRHNFNQEQDQPQHHDHIESNNPTGGGGPPPAIKITAYRLTVTAATISFGLAKFLLTGEGKSLQPNVIDFVMGVPLALLYVRLIASCISKLTIFIFIFDYKGCFGWDSGKVQRHPSLRGSLWRTLTTKS